MLEGKRALRKTGRGGECIFKIDVKGVDAFIWALVRDKWWTFESMI
jgi:hypothetical protein